MESIININIEQKRISPLLDLVSEIKKLKKELKRRNTGSLLSGV
jgi:hypothetical protein